MLLSVRSILALFEYSSETPKLATCATLIDKRKCAGHNHVVSRHFTCARYLFSHFIDLSLASASRPHGPQTSDAFSEWTANMKKNWIDLLYELPVDVTLREFLTGQGLLMPDDFSWTDKTETTQALISALLGCPNIALRDTVAAKLRASVTLGDSAGAQAMFQVATGDGAALTALATCKSDIHRSFCLYVRHPELFDRAGDVDHFERQSANAQQHDLGVKTIPDTSDAALAALRSDVSAFYQRELQCGERSKAYVMERSPGVFLLSVHVKDLSTVQLEFQGDDLKRRVGNPNIHSVLEYSTRTGVTRSLVKGGAKYHQMLLKAFAEHLLHTTLDAQRLVAPTLDLSALRLGFDVPQAVRRQLS